MMTIPESGGGGEYGDHPRPAFRSSRLFYLKKEMVDSSLKKRAIGTAPLFVARAEVNIYRIPGQQ